MHKLRAHIESRIAECGRCRRSSNQESRNYSPERYVLERLLEFPFEEYPDHAYPGHLLRHESMRWRNVEQVIRFCEKLVQPKGSRAGEPIRLLGFQVLMIACILGPFDPKTDLRLIRTVVMTIARKNAKSTTVAMMYLAMMSLSCFNLRAQDIQVGAADREQAGILFDLIQNLVLLDENLGLADIFHLVPSKKSFTNKLTYSRLHCLSSDAYRAHGANPMSVLLDEFGNLPDGKAREFYGVLSTAFGSQEEPLLMMFSTQAPTDSHIFSEFVDRAKANNATVDDPTLCGFLFELAKTDDGTGLVLKVDDKGKITTDVDHYAEANWTRSNPALEGLCPGGFRSLPDLRGKAREARNMPSLENSFRNLQLNQRIVATSPFLSQIAWEGAQHEYGIIPEHILEESLCYVAMDLSARRDLTARASVWVLESGKLYARVRFYTPADGLQAKAARDRVPLDVWADQGHIFATPGKVIDFTIVAEELRDHSEQYPVETIGYDRWRIQDLIKECEAVGFSPYESEEGEYWVPIGQGFKDQNPCVEALETAVIDNTLWIERNPCLTWNATNAVTVSDPTGARKFEKSKSYGRIDGIVALAMAVRLATLGHLDDRAGTNDSVYEDENHGLIIL